MVAKRLDIGVLGPLQMSVDGEVMPLGTPKQRAVLAMLVMSRNRAVSSDSLVERGVGAVPAARTEGQPALLHLESAQARRPRRPRRPKAVLASAPPGYRLAITDEDCDIGRFVTAEERRGAGRSGWTVRAGQPAFLDDALAQWRGPVLDDLSDFEFVDPFATALIEDKVVVHTARAEAADRLQSRLCRHRRARESWSPSTPTASRCGRS